MFARQIVASLLLLALTLQPASACIWDRDTLQSEASGYHEILKVIAGRFPRNPPIFYESRLARVENEIAADPNNLALYDDAGVACDRLHRSAEAIAWMEKKAAVLAGHPDKEHQYRYHANLGTFLIHQWLAAGTDPAQPEGKLGADHIRKAIEINPDAHFGREVVQLQAIEWILTERGAIPVEPDSQNLFIHLHEKRYLPPKINRRKTLEGLAGLVALGAAWESVDIFDTMAQIFSDQNDASMAMLAQLRVAELVADGRRSFAEDASDTYSAREDGLNHTGHIKKWYAEAREAADSWHAARVAYLEKEINGGRHPDTHPEFWNGFDEGQHALPKLPRNSPSTSGRFINGLKIAGGIAVALLFGLIAYQSLRNRKPPCAPAK